MLDTFIHHCLTLASKGRGSVGINPMVGALLVRDGKIIAEAFHDHFGGDHAEAILIKEFDQKFQQENRLIVNLEPCCHTEKKTPPCTEAIIRSGIAHVVIGMVDPNPAVNAKGIATLQKAGIEVVGPVERARCEWFNRGFISLQTKGRPWITLHEARTRDGRHAKDDRTPLKITSEEQDRWYHEQCRAKHDAILVGVHTIICDNPKLTVRFGSTEFQPLRIVLDPNLTIPLAAEIVNGEMAKGTIVVKESEESKESKEKVAALEACGVRVLCVPLDQSKSFVWSELWKQLTTPTKDFFGITSILVEGGEKTWERFRKAQMVDCEVVLMGKS